MQAKPFISIAQTPAEKLLDQQLAEAAQRGDELLSRRLAERQPKKLAREPRVRALAFDI